MFLCPKFYFKLTSEPFFKRCRFICLECAEIGDGWATIKFTILKLFITVTEQQKAVKHMSSSRTQYNTAVQFETSKQSGSCQNSAKIYLPTHSNWQQPHPQFFRLIQHILTFQLMCAQSVDECQLKSNSIHNTPLPSFYIGMCIPLARESRRIFQSLKFRPKVILI